MPRPIAVTAEFTFSLEAAPGRVCADIECCATAKVLPGSPATWCDGGSGPEVLAFTDIMIDCGGYDKAAGRHVCDWVEPDTDLTQRILNYLHDGHADSAFLDAADNAGGYADHRSAMA